jgi:hypothetical protein
VEVVDVLRGNAAQAHRRAVVGDLVPSHLEHIRRSRGTLLRRQETEDQRLGRQPREREHA